jgi:ferrous iron transport protein A
MGLTPGVTVILKRIAPLGDPVEIGIRGYNLSLRKTEAQAVEVEPLEKPEAVEE